MSDKAILTCALTGVLTDPAVHPACHIMEFNCTPSVLLVSKMDDSSTPVM